ncbi:cobyric acid synthase [Agarivorans gilvus]|jgi:adenosylcobyric acid synthase|uniref:Cobyric acid synthase n=1 Tax=Agarivorans gilvus TaxID=680279 RepID=A0ABQ1HVL0_9ALTE|nr:cobyric acid synthase [Agarivorans gilvus]GGA93005.1 cobyric acid synthase [Agarivorans gilvus]
MNSIDNVQRPLMFMGCTSDAGKSLVCALMCRYLANQGFTVAPFKAQNMSNNAAVTPEGGEIGRAQYLQAIAAKQPACADMNPVLLKPHSEKGAQVVVNGKVSHELHAKDWHQRKAVLWPAVTQSLAQLKKRFPLLVIEGAGSPAEVNLRKSDIVNMEVALHTDASVYLIADIDRGGAYAHLLGTWMCLSQAEQAKVKGFVLNKFRGEQALLEEANIWLEQKTGIPIVAVIPWTAHQLPEEDNFFHRSSWQAQRINIALIVYPYASNLDEFDPLIYQAGVNVVPLREAQDLTQFDAIILPGTKHVEASRRFLAETGLESSIVAAAKDGVRITGICGGLQILGMRNEDPEGIEGHSFAGLGLLALATEYGREKLTQQRLLSWRGELLRCYEIHHGQTRCLEPIDSFVEEGLGWQQANIQACYLHDLFTNQSFCQDWLEGLGWQGQCQDWHQQTNDELDRVSRLLALPLQQIAEHARLRPAPL